MNELPNPLTPADCNLRDFGFMPLDVKRLLTSETWILGTGDERAAAITLWLESWHQVPAASLPDDDRMLAHLSQSKAWKKVKAHSLRGWVKCADGRFYHPVVAEKSLEAWIEKLLASLSGAAGNAKRWGVEVDIDAISARVIEAVELLKTVAPQSKTLRKKQVVAIVSGSQPDKKPIAPRSDEKSPPESPPDRNRQRQGEGQGEVNSGSVIVDGKPPRGGRDDFTPKDEGEWLRHFKAKHGFEADPTSIHDRKKIWPVFAGWVNAGLTTEFVDKAVATAIASAKNGIGCLPVYVDRVIASQSQPPRLSPDEQRRAISERNGDAWLADDPQSDPNVIDMEH
jgi:hypothetical protein